MTHYLKIKDEYYQRIVDGVKKFEVRFNDRDYQVFDLIEFTNLDGNSSRKGVWRIVYIHSGYGLKDEFLILGIEQLKP